MDQSRAGERKPTQNERRSEATRERILEAAHVQFVENGLDGARMEAIARAAGVNKALVYRHFTDRETLYRQVLRRTYTRMRTAEASLGLPADPLEALDQIVSFTLHYYIEHPDFLVLVGIENLKRGEHVRRIGPEELLASSLVGAYRTIIDKGVSAGLFRPDIDPVDLYAVVASQCWFAVATRYTFGITFDVDFSDPEQLRHREHLIRDTVRSWVVRRQDDRT